VNASNPNPNKNHHNNIEWSIEFPLLHAKKVCDVNHTFLYLFSYGIKLINLNH